MESAARAPVIRLQKSYYVSLCWYGLRLLGFAGEDADPAYAAWARRLSRLGDAFGFHAPLAGGPLFAFVYQIPGYLDPRDPPELLEVMELGKSFLRTGDVQPLLDRWPGRTHYWDRWYHAIEREDILHTFAGQADAACHAIDGWVEYMQALWPDYRELYLRATEAYPFAEYEQRCRDLEAFRKWQAELGLAYPFSDFVLVICPESPTQASSLGPEKVVFGAQHPWQQMQNAVVHEIGVRYLAPHLFAEHPAASAVLRADQLGLLRLLETEVCYRKPRLLPALQEDAFIDGMGLQALVEWRARQKVKGDLVMAIAGLYAKARKEGLL